MVYGKWTKRYAFWFIFCCTHFLHKKYGAICEACTLRSLLHGLHRIFSYKTAFKTIFVGLLLTCSFWNASSATAAAATAALSLFMVFNFLPHNAWYGGCYYDYNNPIDHMCFLSFHIFCLFAMDSQHFFLTLYVYMKEMSIIWEWFSFFFINKSNIKCP